LCWLTQEVAVVNGTFRWLRRMARGFVRFAREVDHGIAVGRGYAPVGKNTEWGRGAQVGRGKMRAHRTGRRCAGGWV
jgi:hypothetical protein